MARPKKNDSQILVNITIDFYEQEGNGDPSQLRYTLLAAYAKSKGYNVEEYDFRRDAAVRATIDAIRAKQEKHKQESMIAAYRNIDMDALLQHCTDVEDLKQKIAGLDHYWRGVYEEAVRTKQENERLHRLAENQRETRELREKVQLLQMELDESQMARKRLLKENTYLRQFLRKSVYPTLAEELLRQENLPMPKNQTLKPEAFDALIEGEHPQTFTGNQGVVPQEISRQEQLLKRMKQQIDKR